MPLNSTLPVFNPGGGQGSGGVHPLAGLLQALLAAGPPQGHGGNYGALGTPLPFGTPQGFAGDKSTLPQFGGDGKPGGGMDIMSLLRGLSPYGMTGTPFPFGVSHAFGSGEGQGPFFSQSREVRSRGSSSGMTADFVNLLNSIRMQKQMALNPALGKGISGQK